MSILRPIVILALLPPLLACQVPPPEVDLSPARWEEETRRRAFAHNASFSGGIPEGRGDSMMIVGTTGPPAIEAGFQALRQGGSAADAVLTTALAQIALVGGSWVSYAGLFTMVYFDASTGEVHSLNAAFDIPRGEDDPGTIPAQGTGEASGRTALVPGFMAGVGAAHERFGLLPFDQLFVPAIHFAEEGFVVPRLLAGMIDHRRDVLSRLPETKRVFTREDGSFLVEGDWFRQPELAATLRAVAAEGVDYMYTGPWAQHLVGCVQRDGGKMTMEDLADYRVAWSEPARSSYWEFDVCAAGLPGMGGVNAIECFNLLEVADVDPVEDSADAFFWWIQLTNIYVLSFITPAVTQLLLPGATVNLETRVTKEWAAEMWLHLLGGSFALTRKPRISSHSDAVVAVDRRGNVAAIVHSINTTTWGETGIFVDGVSIPDAASYQQAQIAQAGAGNRLPDPTNPLLVLRDGRVVLASSSIGAGLHQVTAQCVSRVLREGLDPAEALRRPTFHLPSYDRLGMATAQVAEGELDVRFLDEVRSLGQPVLELSDQEMRGVRGYWIGIRIDESGKLAGGTPGLLNGWVRGE